MLIVRRMNDCLTRPCKNTNINRNKVNSEKAILKDLYSFPPYKQKKLLKNSDSAKLVIYLYCSSVMLLLVVLVFESG